MLTFSLLSVTAGIISCTFSNAGTHFMEWSETAAKERTTKFLYVTKQGALELPCNDHCSGNAVRRPEGDVQCKGDSVGLNYVKGGGKKGRDLYEITITAKLIDSTARGLSPRELENLRKQLTKQIQKSFSGNDKFIEFRTTAIFTVAKSEADVNEGDHIVRIVDDLAKSIGVPDAPGTNTVGTAVPLHKIVTLELSKDFGRVAAHEFGHSFGLDHIKNSPGPDGQGGWTMLTTDDYPGNLMHQDQDLNSRGLKVAGTTIRGFQVLRIYSYFRAGRLNKGHR
jgi:hypothetical protein